MLISSDISLSPWRCRSPFCSHQPCQRCDLRLCLLLTGGPFCVPTDTQGCAADRIWGAGTWLSPTVGPPTPALFMKVASALLLVRRAAVPAVTTAMVICSMWLGRSPGQCWSWNHTKSAQGCWAPRGGEEVSLDSGGTLSKVTGCSKPGPHTRCPGFSAWEHQGSSQTAALVLPSGSAVC